MVNHDLPTEMIENFENSVDSSINKGGKTDYYSLPPINEERLQTILETLVYIASTKDYNNATLVRTIDAIKNIFPNTLNDLIEYKDMKPFQHEIFKACYALQERSKRNIDGNDTLRELYKMKYYVERGIALAKAGKI